MPPAAEIMGPASISRRRQATLPVRRLFQVCLAPRCIMRLPPVEGRSMRHTLLWAFGLIFNLARMSISQSHIGFDFRRIMRAVTCHSSATPLTRLLAMDLLLLPLTAPRARRAAEA